MIELGAYIGGGVLGNWALKYYYRNSKACWGTKSGALRIPNWTLLFVPTTLVLLCYRNNLPISAMLPQALFLVVMYWIAVIDYQYHMIPNRLLGMLLAYRVLQLVASDVLFSINFGQLQEAFMGMIVIGGVAIMIYLVSKGSIGAGDVKLLSVLGLYYGMIPSLTIICYALILGGIVGVVIMVKQRKWRELVLPFAPFLYGALIISRCFGWN